MLLQVSHLGVTINKDLTWTKHLNQTIGKASKILGFLRRNLQRCTTKTKATAYTMETHLGDFPKNEDFV
jgi:hypothetical protein